MAVAINRYQGNSGRVVRYSDNEPAPPPVHPTSQPVHPMPPQKGGSPLAALEGLNRLLPDKIGELETEDIILLLILYLMYRESGDSDLLIIMGAMFLL